MHVNSMYNYLHIFLRPIGITVLKSKLQTKLSRVSNSAQMTRHCDCLRVVFHSIIIEHAPHCALPDPQMCLDRGR